MPPSEREEATQLGTNPALGHVGPYALIDTLGRGGMARVYLARHSSTGTMVAVKRPHPDQRHDPAIRGRFVREVEIGRRLVHRYTTRLIEADTTSDWPYAVFELVPGLNLDQVRKGLVGQDRLLPYPVTMTLLCRALEAVGAAHRLDIVHRDISPRNVMLSFDGSVRLIDFGAAKADLEGFSTRPGTEMGSLRYASPEMFRGERVGHLADIYAVAAIAYELLSGSPLVGRFENILQAARIVTEMVPPPISSVNPAVPADISAIVAKALAKSPNDRPQSAQALAESLVLARPEWCSLDAGKIREFLEAWFPAEAAALARFFSAESAGPIEEDVLRTVLAPAPLARPPTITASPRLASEVAESAGLQFPMTPMGPANGKHRVRKFGMGAVVATGLLSATSTGLGVAFAFRPGRAQPTTSSAPAPPASAELPLPPSSGAARLAQVGAVPATEPEFVEPLSTEPYPPRSRRPTPPPSVPPPVRGDQMIPGSSPRSGSPSTAWPPVPIRPATASCSSPTARVPVRSFALCAQLT